VREARTDSSNDTIVIASVRFAMRDRVAAHEGLFDLEALLQGCVERLIEAQDFLRGKKTKVSNGMRSHSAQPQARATDWEDDGENWNNRNENKDEDGAVQQQTACTQHLIKQQKARRMRAHLLRGESNSRALCDVRWSGIGYREQMGEGEEGERAGLEWTRGGERLGEGGAVREGGFVERVDFLDAQATKVRLRLGHGPYDEFGEEHDCVLARVTMLCEWVCVHARS